MVERLNLLLPALLSPFPYRLVDVLFECRQVWCQGVSEFDLSPLVWGFLPGMVVSSAYVDPWGCGRLLHVGVLGGITFPLFEHWLVVAAWLPQPLLPADMPPSWPSSG